MTWYLRREWVDQEDGIENVMIHYTWSPPGGWPDWERNHNARMLADAGGLPRRRWKVIRMPRGVHDEHGGGLSLEYRLHYFFEVWQDGRNWHTDLESQDIVYRDMEYVDNEGWVTHLCVYWSVYDWQAPVYSPMEDPRFPADSEFTSERYYAYSGTCTRRRRPSRPGSGPRGRPAPVAATGSCISDREEEPATWGWPRTSSKGRRSR